MSLSQILFFVISTVVGTTLILPFGYLRSQFSKSADAESQGLVLAGIAALEIVANVVASLLFTNVFRCIPVFLSRLSHQSLGTSWECSFFHGLVFLCLLPLMRCM